MEYRYIILLLFMLPVVNAYNLDILETNPSPIRAGEYADVTVRLLSTFARNEVKNDVTLSIKENEDIRPISGQEYTIRELRGGDQVTRTFRVFFGEGLPAGNVPINFMVTDNGASVTLKEEVFLKGTLKTPELFIGELRTIPKELLKDSENNRITMTLQNLGDKKAELLTAEVIDLDCCIAESFTYSLRDSVAGIDGGEEATLSFTFDILETAKDIITPTLLVRYRTRDDLTDSYRTVTVNIPFEIPVTKAPDLKIVKIEAKSSIETRSQENQLHVTIRNDGEKEGKSVRIRLYPDPSYPFDFERTNYFVTSRLKPGENATVIIKFDVLDFASVQSYPITAELESLVGDSRYIQDADLEITVSGIGTNQAVVFRTGFLIAAGAIAILLGLTTFLSRLRR